MILDKILKQLSLLTKGKTPSEKMEFLKDIGYNSFKEIKQLTDEQKADLFNFLLTRGSTGSTTENGYKINRPEKPKSIKDISFSIED